MKLHKKQLVSGSFLVVMLLLLFTPLGSIVRARVSMLLSAGAAVLKTEMQTPLDTYQWQLDDLKGDVLNFEAQKGEVVFINFWATWCPPCVAEMPGLQKLYNDYGDKVTFLFVAKDRRERVNQFLEKKGYELPVYYAMTKDPDVLASKVLPTTYIIDRKGKIRIAKTGSSDWNGTQTRTLLDTLLKE